MDVSPADAALLISGVGLLSAVPAFVHRETGFGRSKHDRGMARKRVTHRAATGMRCVPTRMSSCSILAVRPSFPSAAGRL